MTLAPLLFAFLLHRTPTPTELSVAFEIDAVAEELPLFAGPDGVAQTVRLLTAIAYREGGLQLGIVGDGGRSVCTMQILNGPRSLLTDARACVRAGHAILARSVAICPAHPVAVYARGRCDSIQGRRISADRVGLANRLKEVTK
jgi:hypothetical protein